MEGKEIFEQFNTFVVDTIEKKVTLIKRNQMIVKITKWSDGRKDLDYLMKNQAISFIEENLCLLHVG